MVYRKPDISDLAGEFRQLADSPACANRSEPDDRRWYRFARQVRELREQEDHRSLQSAFDRLEEYLSGGNQVLRDWAMGFLQALQDVVSWSSQDGEPFLRFMGDRTRHVWATLDTIRHDLADCSILEAEVLMWRVVHPARPGEARS
ncbi:MAG TPA: hypothetical protein VLL05_20565 [Terriglobales bacterium]|nr:hypothetical protein [Terriglobales bacterium]